MSNPRKDAASRIKDNPGRYKVCLGCDSIVATKVGVCPNCHGYRYETDPVLVGLHADELSSRPQESVTPEDLKD